MRHHIIPVTDPSPEMYAALVRDDLGADWTDDTTPRTDRPVRFAAHLNDFADGGAIETVVALAAMLRAGGWLPYTAYTYRVIRAARASFPHGPVA